MFIKPFSQKCKQGILTALQIKLQQPTQNNTQHLFWDLTDSSSWLSSLLPVLLRGRTARELSLSRWKQFQGGGHQAQVQPALLGWGETRRSVTVVKIVKCWDLGVSPTTKIMIHCLLCNTTLLLWSLSATLPGGCVEQPSILNTFWCRLYFWLIVSLKPFPVKETSKFKIELYLRPGVRCDGLKSKWQSERR